MNTPCL
jgi:hypothetical protein